MAPGAGEVLTTVGATALTASTLPAWASSADELQRAVPAQSLDDCADANLPAVTASAATRPPTTTSTAAQPTTRGSRAPSFSLALERPTRSLVRLAMRRRTMPPGSDPPRCDGPSGPYPATSTRSHRPDVGAPTGDHPPEPAWQAPLPPEPAPFACPSHAARHPGLSADGRPTSSGFAAPRPMRPVGWRSGHAGADASVRGPGKRSFARW